MTDNDLQIWSTQAISDVAITPDTPAVADLNLVTAACRGQTVPLSFCVRCSHPITIEASIQGHPDGPRAHLRYVRHGNLVHDPNLVVSPTAIDAVEIVPICLDADSTQQYWLTIEVPDHCRTGQYWLRLKIRGFCRDGWQERAEFPVVVSVPSFELAAPGMTYAVYHLAALYYSGPLAVHTPAAKYCADHRCMASHGITVSLCYEDLTRVPESEGGFNKLKELLLLRGAAGVRNEPFFSIVNGMPWTKPDEFDALKTRIRVLRQVLAQYGVNDLYLYGKDDLTSASMVQQRPIWQAAREAGAKVFAACMGNHAAAWAIVKDCLDLPMFNSLGANLADWHSLGHKTGFYGPAGNPLAETNHRRRYGLPRLAEGWDGCCVYAWEDPASGENYVHSTASGPIETLPLWGLHEAVTDVRYAQTLLDRGGIVPDSTGRDLDEVREEMIGRILLGKDAE